MSRGIKLAACIGLLCLGTGLAWGQLSIEPITWDVVGLDSNRPLTSGPDLFPSGVRICSAVDTTNVVVTFVWPDGNGSGWDFGSGDPYINTRPGSLTSLSFPALTAGQCVDAYFELKVTRDPAAFGQTRPYVITVDDDLGNSASTPANRSIRVEYLVSQNRNATDQIRWGQLADESDWVTLADGGSISLAVGQSYYVELTTNTATAYEQLQSFLTLSNTIFRVLDVETTYSNLTAPPDRVPVPNPRLWANGCLWDSNTDSPNYHSCLDSGKAGGTVVTTYHITIISGGGEAVGLEALIYDRSGGSFHYNTDFIDSPGDLATYDPTSADFSKKFTPAIIGSGETTRLRFTITNPNPEPISDYSFVDNLPAGLEVANPPNASSSCGGTWSPAAGDTTLNFSGGAIGANSSCTILVDVTGTLTGTYNNISGNLFIGPADTGSNATATLEISATPPPVTQCDTNATMANWQFPLAGSATAPVATSNLVTVSAAAGAGLNPSIGADNNDSGGSWTSDFIAVGALNTANNDYFEFTVDTTGLDEVTLNFAARRTSQGAQSLQLYYGSSAQFASTTYSISSQNTWIAMGPTTLNTNINSSGNTVFRLYAYNASQNNNGHTVAIDGVTFKGLACQSAPPPSPTPGVSPPTVSKSFSPAVIGVGHTSTLTFTITNPNASALTGIVLNDELPTGLTIVPGTFSTTCSGYWDLDPNDSSVLLFSGGSLAAGASCTFEVDVTSSSIGSTLNVSELVYAIESGYNNDLATGVAQAELKVLAPPIIEKNFDPSLLLLGTLPNDATTLTFTITNPNANDAISGISFTDNLPAGVVVANPTNATTGSCGAPTWSPLPGDTALSFASGAIAAGGTCTVTVDVTGPSGVYNNTSSAVTHLVSGVPDTNGETAQASLVIDDPIPAVALSKQVGSSADPDGTWSDYLAVAVGGTYYYKFTVENIGETALTNIALSDPDLDTSGCSWPVTLPVADVLTPTDHIAVCILGPFTASTSGVFPNTATVSADHGATTVQDSDSATYATASLSFDKSASPTTFTAAGESITYTFTITNTGNAILQPPLTVVDPLVGSVSCPDLSTVGNNDGFFDPGESASCSAVYTTQAADVTNGVIENTAHAEVAGIDSPEDTATVTLLVAALETAKALTANADEDSSGSITEGDTLTYTVTVTNTGDITLNNVVVSDALISPTGGSTPCATLAVGASCTLVGTYVVTAADVTAGSITNTGSGDSDETAADEDILVTPVAGSPALATVKSLTANADEDGSGTVTEGDTLTYTVTATNTGDVPLSNVVVSDNLISPTGGSTPCATLAVGASCTLVGTYVVTAADVTAGSITNTGTGDSDETPADDDILVTPVVGSPALTTAKALTANADEDSSGSITEGDTLTYTVTATNTGNVPLSNVVVSDSLISPTGGSTPCATLAVGASCTLVGTYVVTAADVTAGSITNTGTGDSDETLADDDTLVTPVVGSPALTTAKALTANADEDGSGTVTEGDTLTYTVTATNTGNVSLSNVVVSDSLISPTGGSTPCATLAVGASCTLVGTYVVTAADVTAGSISNTGSGDSDETLADDDTLVTPVVGSPALTTAKALTANADEDSSGSITEGDTLTYTVTVTNTGNVPLSNVVVSDSLISPTGGSTPCATLAVGASCTLVGTYVVTAADVTAGSITNTGTGDSDETAADDDILVTPLVGTPALTTVKSLTANADEDGSGTITEGDTLTYTVTATNSGDVALSNVVVSDPMISPTGGSTPCASLAVGASCTLVGTYVVTASDVTAGSITNTGSGDSNETPADEDTLVTPVVGSPVLTTAKALTANADEDSSGTITEGDTLTYTVTVTNTGNVPLSNVVVSDSLISPTGGSTPCATLAVGASCTLVGTYVVTAADVTAGSITNTGTGDSDETPADEDTLVTPLVGSPALTTVKSLTANADEDSSGTITEGDTLTYTVTATNTGNVPLSNVVVSDSLISPTGGTTPCATLAVGASCTLVGTYVVTASDVTAGSITNTGTGDSDETPAGEDTLVTPVVGSPALTTAKALTANADEDSSGTITEGDTLTYTVTVTNTGNVPLSNVVVTDSLISPTGGSTPCATLAVGASCTLVGTYVVTAADVTAGSITNTGSGDSDETPADEDTLVTVLVGTPALTTVKSLTANADEDGSGTVTEGDTLTYTVTATNSGDVVLSNVVVSDSLISPTGGSTPCATLAVGASCTLVGTYVVTAADVTAGSISNTGTGDSNETPADDDTLVTPVVGSPALTTTKALTANADEDSSGTITEGDTLTYTVTATNTGNVPLSNVVVSDSLISPTGGSTPCATLAVGASCTLVGTYVVTAADVTSGSITNTGTGDSDETPADEDTLVTPVVGSPALTTAKALTANADEDSSGTITEGDTLTYTVTVTNIGNVPLSNVVVSDSLISPTGGSTPCATLAVGASCTLVGTYVVTAADVTTGSITNTGSGDSDETPADEDTLVTVLVGTPALTTVKSLTANADEDGSGTVTEGDTLTYTVTATNSGDVALSNVVVSDSLISPTGGSTPCATLAVGASCTLVGTYVVTASDVTAGSITNTGTGDSNETPADEDTLVTPVVGSPALTTTKALTDHFDANQSGSVNEGDTLTYTVTATNTGNVPLHNVVVSDSLITPTGGTTPCATLAVGASCTLIGTYVVTAADASAGSITNTGSGDSDETPADEDTVVTPVEGSPALAVAKALSGNADEDKSGTITAGDTLTYTVTVTNTGNVPLHNVVVSDSLITPTGGTTPCAILAVGESCTLIGTYVVTVKDESAGSISNTGTGDSDETPSGEVTIITPLSAAPALQTVKTLSANADEDGSLSVTEGDTLTYTVTTTNTGNVTLNNVVVTDSLITPTGGSTPCATLAVGASCTLVGTYVVTAADVTAGSITNTGSGDSDETPADEDTTITPVLGSPALQTVKTLSANADEDKSGSVTEGDTLTYTVTVTNTGNVALTNVVVTDSLITPTGGTTPCATLAVGESCTLIGTYVVTAGDVLAGSITNTGSGDSDQTGPDDDTLITPVIGGNPQIQVSKSADPANGTAVAPGATLTYTLTMTVSSGPTKSDVVLTDTLDADLTFGSVTANAGGFTAGGAGNTRTFTLASGAVNGVYTVSYTATVNANASGTVGNLVVPSGGGDPDPDCTSCATSHPVVPQIQLAKSADPASGSAVAPGDTITYSLTLTVSNGPTTAEVVLTDTLDPDLTFGSVTANPGGFTAGGAGNTRSFTLASGAANGTYSVSYSATVNADAKGAVGNSVVPSGGGDPDPDCVGCSTSHPLSPQIAVEKSADPAAATPVTPGQTLTYTLTLTVTNGPTTEDTVLTDTLDPDLAFGAVTANSGGFSLGGSGNTRTFTLAAGAASGTYAVSYSAVVAQTAVGTVGNQVVASGGGDPDPDCLTCVTQHPVAVIGLAKRVVGSQYDPDTQLFHLDYGFLVSNPGQVELTNVQVTDDLRATFPLPIQFTVTAISSPDFAVNTGFDGESDQHMLAGTDSLAVGASGTITVSLAIEITATTPTGPYYNTAIAEATGAGVLVSDVSQDGANPDPDGEGPGTHSDPTPVTIPRFVAVPTLGQGALLLFMLGLALAGLIVLRKTR